jgi:glycerophosphoryl diester phosphodiesterase
LPLVLFENITGSSALRVSRERVTGRRRTLLLWIAGWVLASIVLSVLATSAVVFLGRVLVPRSTGSLELMVVTVGLTLTLSVVVNLVVNLMSTTTLATILFGLYRKFGSKGRIELPNLNTAAAPDDRTGLKVTRKRLLGISIIGIVLAAVVGVAAIETVRLEDHTEITAHRGSSASAPENTLAAVRKAIEDGADWVEFDVQETADGEVVLLHDRDFMRVAGVDLKIWDVTRADLADIDIGSGFAPEFKDERVPTLSDVLAECKGKIRVNIELKYYGHNEELEQRVIDVVEAHGMSPDVVIMSLKIDAVRRMKSLRPGWKIGLLTTATLGNVANVNADFLAVNTRARRSFVRSAHEIGKEVYVWTVNDAVTMSTMIGRNVDNLITDRPALARAVLQQRARICAPERLLLELAEDLGVAPELGEP